MAWCKRRDCIKKESNWLKWKLCHFFIIILVHSAMRGGRISTQLGWKLYLDMILFFLISNTIHMRHSFSTSSQTKGHVLNPTFLRLHATFAYFIATLILGVCMVQSAICLQRNATILLGHWTSRFWDADFPPSISLTDFENANFPPCISPLQKQAHQKVSLKNTCPDLTVFWAHKLLHSGLPSQGRLTQAWSSMS